MNKLRLSDDEVRLSFNWFTRQRESAPFMAFLHTVLTEIGPTDTCALHRHDERRKFAADLIAMAETEKSDGPDQPSDGQEQRNDKRGGQRKSRRHGPQRV